MKTTNTLAKVHGNQPSQHSKIAIIGTGFSGLGMAVRLRQEGFTDFVIYEKATEVGGTWA
ncbi:NAD(P)-binding protein, partial [Enterococcus faecium]|uniref:NAD(P)-binding protein n=1 Tax=Enterococcus faecium TaxID=1352 RepID=UPI003F42B168